MREFSSLYACNRGVVSHLGLARADVKRVAMGAETQTNWMPRVLGSMALRPGLQYLGATYANSAARFLKFIFSTDDTALLEMTDYLMRVWIDDELLTRPSVSTSLTAMTSWTDADEGSAASTYAAGSMKLIGTGTSAAIRKIEVTVGGTNIGTEHALRITVTRGPLMVRVGSTDGGDDYVKEASLGTGVHSIAFTPSGNFWVRFFNRLEQEVWVASCTLESSGVVTITTPWPAASLQNLRHDQSGDIVYVACKDYQQRKIERRGTNPGGRSWSVCLYAPEDGPFLIQNITPTTITPSAISGNITLTASTAIFKSTHVGALFSLTSSGQQVIELDAAVNGTAGSSIRVIGITNERVFSIIIAGNANSSTVDLQRSYDDTTWANVSGQQWTADTTTTYDDGLDNQIVYYRLILTTRVAPDEVDMTLTIGSGSIRGICRVTGYTSATVVSAEVISDLGGITATDNWQEGQWSDKRGWPTSVRFHEGRLWWSGLNGIWGSISDAYDSFNEDYVGNAGPINRTIGSGPVDTINWLLSLKGLILGAEGAEFSARASSLDEPLTPTNFNIKSSSTQGSGSVDAVKIDQSGYFVNRSGSKVFGLSFDLKEYDFSAANLMELCPEIGLPGIVRIDCQRLPDTRIHCVRSDGTVAIAVISRAEDVLAWVEFETDGLVEDVVTLPALNGDLDDQVYYVVKRTINGSTARYLEKWAQEIDCRGGAMNKQADSFITRTSSSSVIAGLSHLEGEEVVVWGDGQDIGTDDSGTTWTQTYTVTGGEITMSSAPSSVCVGLPYTAQFKSAKLGAVSNEGSPLSVGKRITQIGLILADLHPRGLRFGADFDNMDDLPLMEDGTEIGTSTQTDHDYGMVEFPGTWTTDSRVCLKAVAPRPCTVLAVTFDQESHR